jgi:hypothetical protein
LICAGNHKGCPYNPITHIASLPDFKYSLLQKLSFFQKLSFSKAAVAPQKLSFFQKLSFLLPLA